MDQMYQLFSGGKLLLHPRYTLAMPSFIRLYFLNRQESVFALKNLKFGQQIFENPLE